MEDELLLLIWDEMVKTHKAEAVFYTGKIRNGDEWLAFIKTPKILPVAVANVKKAKFSGIAWLSDCMDGVAYAHFCVLGRPSRELGRVVLDYWGSFTEDDSRPLFRVIVGVTPAHYELPLRFISLIGFKRLGGFIPDLCNMVYEGRRMSAIISYFCPGEEN